MDTSTVYVFPAIITLTIIFIFDCFRGTMGLGALLPIVNLVIKCRVATNVWLGACRRVSLCEAEFFYRRNETIFWITKKKD